MKLYVLDTSVVGFAQQRYPIYESYLQSLPGGTPVVTTIITVGEDLSGWLPACRRARNGAERVKAYPDWSARRSSIKEWGAYRLMSPTPRFSISCALKKFVLVSTTSLLQPLLFRSAVFW